jgi:hypothetical protein
MSFLGKAPPHNRNRKWICRHFSVGVAWGLRHMLTVLASRVPIAIRRENPSGL